MLDKKEGITPSLYDRWADNDFLSYMRNLEPSRVQKILFVYLALLIGYLFVLRLVTPIIMTDTDMWYHLNGGRFFWQTGNIPKTTFFSFIEPQKEWVNYFWGFQSTLYKIYEGFGYQGLIIFRALLFVLTVGFVLAFIFSAKKSRQNPALFIVLGVILVTILAARSTAVRPHLISFLMIIVFIYILQCRQHLAPILPILTLVWANMHGVEWVVGALISGAYFIERIYVRRKSGSRFEGGDYRYLISIVACAGALLLNPYGFGILQAPFAHDPYIFMAISELRQINTKVLYAFNLSANELNLSTSVTLLVVLEVFSLVVLIAKRSLRVSHLIMALGGAYLLTKAARFYWEWALLTLPIVHSFINEYEFSIKRKSRNVALRAILVGYFVLMPFVSLSSEFSKFSNYPFDSRLLPASMVEFLKQNDAKGNLLGHPGTGGYYQWELYPDIKIYIDMEFPPFNSEDLFTGMWWVKDKVTFDRVMDKYAVDFVVVGVDKKDFPEFAPQFAPVFLGDRHILFANKSTQRDMVEKYEIKKLNPFYLLDDSLSPEEIIVEVKKLEKINPRSIRVNKVLAMTLFDEKRFSEALVYAERYQKYYPLDPNSHYWVGNVLEHLDRCDEALPHYKESLKLSEDAAFIRQLKRQIGACEYFNKNFEEAQYWFSQSINLYRYSESPIDIYQYAYSTAIVGKREDAIKLLDMLLLRLGPDDEETRVKAEKFKYDLETKEVPDVSVLGWLKSL